MFRKAIVITLVPPLLFVSCAGNRTARSDTPSHEIEPEAQPDLADPKEEAPPAPPDETPGSSDSSDSRMLDIVLSLGREAFAGGDYRRADLLFRRATILSPEDDRGWNNLGCVLYETGRYDEAARAFRETVRLTPERFDSHLNLARAYVMAGSYDDARESLDAAREIDPLNPDLRELERLLSSGREKASPG